jgi:uncharacterized protein with ParB-like and HNH nuclease domain
MRMNTLSLQQLFEGRVFKIPNYQRGYSWEFDQVRDLIEDLDLIVQKPHYTGTIVLKNTNEKIDAYGETYTKNEIVDGQQRITSLIILLNEIYKAMKAIGNDEAVTYGKTLLEKYIKRSGLQGAIYKLELDEGNNVYFASKILEGAHAEAKTKSHNLLEKAQIQFSNHLSTKKKEKPSEYFDFLKQLEKKITQFLGFTIYEVGDDSEVGIIFEVLNDRGKPLSKLDIVKNFLIYQTEKISQDSNSRNQLTDKINYGWKEILENLSSADMASNEDENQFLRINFILNFYSEVTEYRDKETNRRVSVNSQLAEVQKLVKKRFKDLEKAGKKDQCYAELENYVDSLTRMSYRLRDLLTPLQKPAFKEVLLEKREEVRSVASQFTRLDIQSNVLPVLVAAYERYSDKSSTENLISLMKLAEIAVFRIYYIADRPSYTAQSQFYALSNNIYRGNLSYEDTITTLKEIVEEYCPKDKITKKLLDIEDSYEWDGIRYFLYELERKRCIDATPDKKPYYPWDALEKAKKEDTIEHILPQTIIEKNGKKIPYWTSLFNKKSHEKNSKRLGNMTLSYSNSKGGNKGFDVKKRLFKKSLWQITRDVGNSYTNWNEKSIDKREGELIEFANQRWGTPNK